MTPSKSKVRTCALWPVAYISAPRPGRPMSSRNAHQDCKPRTCRIRCCSSQATVDTVVDAHIATACGGWARSVRPRCAPCSLQHSPPSRREARPSPEDDAPRDPWPCALAGGFRRDKTQSLLRISMRPSPSSSGCVVSRTPVALAALPCDPVVAPPPAALEATPHKRVTLS